MPRIAPECCGAGSGAGAGGAAHSYMPRISIRYCAAIIPPRRPSPPLYRPLIKRAGNICRLTHPVRAERAAARARHRARRTHVICPHLNSCRINLDLGTYRCARVRPIRRAGYRAARCRSTNVRYMRVDSESFDPRDTICG
ncbi:hypothetical protein EVAR_43489_1 [Eumeta japonica]|uniref:Uncharacterized protein n=1 Tax=Eumeta variegata TaxID=151549 RepID=A0A4C1YJX8_EUMVA|nr:hypothetical protein EVAR_43489_1 [Eumeta japonica]